MRYEYIIDADDYNNLVATVERRIKEEEEQTKIYNALANKLKSYQGKVINARIEKAASLPDYRISYRKQNGHAELYVSKDRQGYYIRLGEQNQERFDVAFLRTKAATLKEKTSKDRQQCNRICEVVNRYNTALQFFKTASGELSSIPHFYSWNR